MTCIFCTRTTVHSNINTNTNTKHIKKDVDLTDKCHTLPCAQAEETPSPLSLWMVEISALQGTEGAGFGDLPSR